uniref:VOC domain-containing protein n=1 Tax=Rhabditophanes sp. KR3021 TaxID=114890 RepID=A0AC35THS4_9BILA
MLGAKMVEDCGVGGPVKMAFSDRQCLIKFGLLPDHVDLKRGNGYGRINFIRPTFQLQEVEKKICETDPDFIYKSALCTEDGYHILVLEDPNNHEIAFIGGEKYLSHHSTPDPAAEQKLLKAIKQEKDS